MAYIQQSFSLFRDVRHKVWNHLDELQEQGFRTVRLEGDGEIAEVCRLTYLEQQITLTKYLQAPALVVNGLKIRLDFNDINKVTTQAVLLLNSY